MSYRTDTAKALSSAFLAGPWTRQGLRSRAAELFGLRHRWMGPLVSRVMKAWPRAPHDARDEVARFIAHSPVFAPLAEPRSRLKRLQLDAPAMRSGSFPVPPLASLGGLAAFLEVDPPQLDFFADRRGLERVVKAEALRHYRYEWIAKRSGGSRLLETPKPRLKELQRRILHQLLDHVPAHDAAHGFRVQRSVVSFAAPHSGQELVLRMDLEDFFASITVARVRALFRMLGYPDTVAWTLSALCTNRVPAAQWARGPLPGHPSEIDPYRRTQRRLASPHLPQGAPTSPALANLCAFGLDVRLAAAAASAGARYTRYADDLAFSGGEEFARGWSRFQILVGRIALEEGMRVNFRKTRPMRRGVRQRLAGVIVNQHPNVAREEYDLLKAILHRCATRGPARENRQGHADLRAHLLGRIGWVAMLNPAKGAKLRATFDRVAW